MGKAEVWQFLWDVERVAKCMPGFQEVREVSPEQRYEVVIEERMGPFKIRFDMEVEVLERREEELVRLQAQGSVLIVHPKTLRGILLKQGINSFNDACSDGVLLPCFPRLNA